MFRKKITIDQVEIRQVDPFTAEYSGRLIQFAEHEGIGVGDIDWVVALERWQAGNEIICCYIVVRDEQIIAMAMGIRGEDRYAWFLSVHPRYNWSVLIPELFQILEKKTRSEGIKRISVPYFSNSGSQFRWFRKTLSYAGFDPETELPISTTDTGFEKELP